MPEVIQADLRTGTTDETGGYPITLTAWDIGTANNLDEPKHDVPGPAKGKKRHSDSKQQQKLHQPIVITPAKVRISSGQLYDLAVKASQGDSAAASALADLGFKVLASVAGRLAAPTEEDTHHVTIEGIEGKHVGKVGDYDGN